MHAFDVVVTAFESPATSLARWLSNASYMVRVYALVKRHGEAYYVELVMGNDDFVDHRMERGTKNYDGIEVTRVMRIMNKLNLIPS